MGPFRRGRTRRQLLAGLAMIALVWSAGTALADDCKRVPNVLILFDASGYMKEKDRYDNLLQQMDYFQQALPVTADGFFNVGVRHLGLKVGLGCQNTESIMSVQPWDPEKFQNCFPKTVSYGVSSLAAGLRAAGDDVAGETGKTAILVVGSGNESCNADPIKIAEQLCANNPDLEIHTFQVGNSQEGTFFLKGIAAKGRGTYTSLDQMNNPAIWHAWMKRHLVQTCPASVPIPGRDQARATSVGPIAFDRNSVSLRSSDPQTDATNVANLQAAGQLLTSMPSARVVLHGYSDDKATLKANLKMSKRRAEAVAHQLMTTFRIPAERLSVAAHGAVAGKPGRVVEFEISP